MCFSGSKSNGAAEAERARQAEAARLEQLKKAEEARILKETLDNKSAIASRESADAATRAEYRVKTKTALEDPEAAKKKALLTNYSG
jgi:hypothetical protein